MPSLTTQKIIMGGSQELFPRDVAGNVLSLIAKRANNGIPYGSGVANPKWYDMSKYKNDCQMNNQAGSVSSGFNSEAISGKTVYFNKLDGADDYGAFVNTPSLDITTGEFALACTFRVAVGAPACYIISKNTGSLATTAFLVYYQSADKTIRIFLNGGDKVATTTILENTWYNIIFYRNSVGLISSYINKVANNAATYSTALTTQSNMRLGAHTTNAGGTTHAIYFKGDIATQSIYQSPTLDINKILRAEGNVSKDYTGVS